MRHRAFAIALLASTALVSPAGAEIVRPGAPGAGPAVQSENIWGATFGSSFSDSGALQLGTIFTPSTNGTVKGIRFCKATGDPNSTHTVYLWSMAGTLLATATSSGETASGYQEADFSSPVALTAGTAYEVSYLSPNAYYCATSSYAFPHSNGQDLIADVANGVFAASATPQLLTSSFNATNYWVDPVFTSTGGGTGFTGQQATLLNGYAYPPSFGALVGGIGFYVGTPVGQTLRNPATISMAGVTVNTGNDSVTVTGNNITLDSYDFGLAGGWAVIIQGANVTISNSNFQVGVNAAFPIFSQPGSGSVTVTYCTIDGGGSTYSNVAGLITFEGHGTLTVDHSWLKNAPGDVIDVQADGNTTAHVNYNLIQNAGLTSGAHGDYTQFIGGAYTVDITYNATTQVGGTTQGFMVEPDIGPGSGSIAGGEIGHNVMTGAVSLFQGVTIADLTGTINVDNNYFDPTNSLDSFATNNAVRGGPNDGNALSVYTGNTNMVAGPVGGWSDSPPGTP